MRIIDWSSDVCSSDLHAGSGIGDVMSLSKLPYIQPKRFDREELGAVAIALTNSAVKGPTYLRVDGKIDFVVLAVEVFDQVWPDRRRAYATADMHEYRWNHTSWDARREGIECVIP